MSIHFHRWYRVGRVIDDAYRSDRVSPCRLYRWTICKHYCRMLLTGHYDQRPFDETVCDAIIANGGLENHQKRCKMFAMTDASNTVQILVACAMQGIRFSSINYLGWGGTKEMGSQMKAFAIYNRRFTKMNCVWVGNTMETVQLNKMCVIRGIHVRNQKCVRRPIIT